MYLYRHDEYELSLVSELSSASNFTVSAYPNETKAGRFAEYLRTQQESKQWLLQ